MRYFYISSVTSTFHSTSTASINVAIATSIVLQRFSGRALVIGDGVLIGLVPTDRFIISSEWAAEHGHWIETSVRCHNIETGVGKFAVHRTEQSVNRNSASESSHCILHFILHMPTADDEQANRIRRERYSIRNIIYISTFFSQDRLERRSIAQEASEDLSILPHLFGAQDL